MVIKFEDGVKVISQLTSKEIFLNYLGGFKVIT